MDHHREEAVIRIIDGVLAWAGGLIAGAILASLIWAAYDVTKIECNANEVAFVDIVTARAICITGRIVDRP